LVSDAGGRLLLGAAVVEVVVEVEGEEVLEVVLLVG
jgi:hypothetical protein